MTRRPDNNGLGGWGQKRRRGQHEQRPRDNKEHGLWGLLQTSLELLVKNVLGTVGMERY